MAFAPITLARYVDLYMQSNPGSDRIEVTQRLESALAEFVDGTRCRCGEPIWVIGSAETGPACFTCITGESTPAAELHVMQRTKRYAPEDPRPDS